MKATFAILIHPIVACRPGLARPTTQRAYTSPASRGESFRKSLPREDEQTRRRSRPVDEKEPSGSFSYLRRLDDLAALVEAAVGADRVRPPRLLAVGAGLQHHERESQVGAPASLLGLG